jgi:hypothetical protein
MSGTHANGPPSVGQPVTRRRLNEASTERAADAQRDHFAHVECWLHGVFDLTVWSDVEQSTCVLHLTGTTPTAEDVPAVASAQLEQAGWSIRHPWIRRDNTWRAVVAPHPAHEHSE